MKLTEFSDTLDTLLNSYNSQAQFGETSSARDIVLNEYEKSVILTQAQDAVIKSYFERNNPQGKGFDDSERRQVDFSSLIKTATLTKEVSQGTVFDNRGIIYKLPTKTVGTDLIPEVLFVLNEKITVEGKDYVVVPLNYKEYDREMSKSYAQPLKKQMWRLFQNATTGFDIYSELIPNSNLGGKTMIYKIRYVKRPNPIVLTTLPNDLTIDGVSVETQCELNPMIHMDIVNKALEIAISTRGGYSQPKQQQEQ